jgi:uncharacterized protein (TIGR03435 family)
MIEDGHNKMKLLLFSLALAAAASAAGLPETGKPAPPLSMAQVMQSPAGTNATWETLKGTPVVLEFWATWCGGCVEGIPHLNRLADQYKSARFISITDEEPELVARFLKQYPISGWVGIDRGTATFDAYGMTGRPQTVLVDASGIVRAVGPPTELTSALMEDFLAARPIRMSSNAQPQKLQDRPNPHFEIMIRPAAPVSVSGYSSGAQMKYGDGMAGFGLTLKRMASIAWRVSESRVEGPEWSGKTGYDMALTFPGVTPEQGAEQLQHALALTFQMKAHKEAREVDAYVLRRIAGTEPKLTRASTAGRSRWGNPGNVKLVGTPVGALTTLIDRTLKLPAFDETGIAGNFDMELTWDPAKPETLIDAIRSQLGLELVKTRRPLDYLVIDSAVRPATW